MLTGQSQELLTSWRSRQDTGAEAKGPLSFPAEAHSWDSCQGWGVDTHMHSHMHTHSPFLPQDSPT